MSIPEFSPTPIIPWKVEQVYAYGTELMVTASRKNSEGFIETIQFQIPLHDVKKVLEWCGIPIGGKS